MHKTRQAKVPIITYHSIDESGSVISTAKDIFRRQMDCLRKENYSVVSLAKFVGQLKSGGSTKPKTIVLTFDDGFLNFYTEAFPIISQYNFGATVFPVTNFCGKFNNWAGNPVNLPTAELLSWKNITEINNCGIEIGSHTVNHPDLTQVSLNRVSRELIESKKLIEDKTGNQVKTFAYPYGKFNFSVKEIAEKNFEAACSVNLGKAGQHSDLFSLERIDAYYLRNPQVFASIASASFDYYLQFRRFLRGLKSCFRHH